jgi:hypothetical protein
MRRDLNRQEQVGLVEYQRLYEARGRHDKCGLNPSSQTPGKEASEFSMHSEKLPALRR